MPDRKVELHPHASARLLERGATAQELIATVAEGDRFPAKFGRTGFRKNFSFNRRWLGKHYSTKQIEAYAVLEEGRWLVISFITKYF